MSRTRSRINTQTRTRFIHSSARRRLGDVLVLHSTKICSGFSLFVRSCARLAAREHPTHMLRRPVSHCESLHNSSFDICILCIRSIRSTHSLAKFALSGRRYESAVYFTFVQFKCGTKCQRMQTCALCSVCVCSFTLCEVANE